MNESHNGGGGTKEWGSSHVIASDAVAGKKVMDELLLQLRDRQWPDHDVFGVHLAMEEALVNAIRHGNRFDQNKVVHILCRVGLAKTPPPETSWIERVWIQITDEGPGFNPAAVPNCTDPENLELPSGRGVMLMRNFMTRVEYNDTGNSVTMEKWRSDAPVHATAPALT